MTRPRPSAPGALRAAAADVAEAPKHLWRGRTLLHSGSLDEAAREFRACLAIDRANLDAWLGLARSLHGVGDLRGAIEGWKNALRLDPNAWQLFNDIGSAWMEMRDWGHASEAFSRAEALSPGQAIIAANRATLALRQGRTQVAIDVLAEATKNHPFYAPAHAGLGFALRDVGRYAESIEAFRRGIELAPDNATYACGLGRALLESGAAEEALSQAIGLRVRRPGHSGALALEVLARAGLGDVEGVAKLLDYDRLMTQTVVTPPSPFPDLAAFNGALASHAKNHRTLLWAPLSHATLQGLHSGSLLVEPRGPIASFEQVVGHAIVDYGRSLPDDNDHPFLAQRPRGVFLKMWTVVLRSQGHQISHIHPESWLSGVYYAKLPESVRTGAGPSGWLEFGEPDKPFPARTKPPIRRVRPEQGLLVLFPSYMYHRTIPFAGGGTRISIAFDVVPVPMTMAV